MKGLVSTWRVYQLPPQAVLLGQTVCTRRKFRICYFLSLGLYVQSTPSSMCISLAGATAVLPALLDRTPAVLQLQPVSDTTDVDWVQTDCFSRTWKTSEPFINLQQSSHINANASTCFEHSFVRSSVFWVRAEISGSWHLRSCRSWGGKGGRKGPFPSDCTSKQCLFCGRPVFSWLNKSSFWNAVSSEDGVLMSGKEDLSFQWFYISIAKRKTWDDVWFLGCQNWNLLHDFLVKFSEFAFPNPLQISWLLSAENLLNFTCKWAKHISN